jgi:hypothetical protein
MTQVDCPPARVFCLKLTRRSRRTCRMDLKFKLAIVADAAKYDASRASSGGVKRNSSQA